MLVKYLGLAPLNLTLDSGKSFYAYPKQDRLYISEQDWMLTKRLKQYKDKNLFRVVEEGDETIPEKPNKDIKAEDRIFEDSQPKFHEQPETLVFNQKGVPIDTRPLTSDEKKQKVAKRHMRLKKTSNQE